MEDRRPLAELVRGDGRVVLAACAAGEPASETQQFGYGLFSYHLIMALQGFGSYTAVDRLPLYELIGHVTTAVLDSARQMRRTQTPSVYGRSRARTAHGKDGCMDEADPSGGGHVLL